MKTSPFHQLVTFSSATVSFTLINVILPPLARAQSAWDNDTCVVSGVATLQGMECLVRNLLNVGVSIVAIGAFIMLLVGAFRYMISGGTPKQLEGAKKTITYAAFGLILALAAWVILNFIGIFTGTSSILNTFRIKI